MARTIAKTISLPLLCALALACSEAEQEPVAPGPSMSSGPAPAALPVAERMVADASGNSPPEIQQLRFVPEQPAAGEPIRVIAETFDADGDAVGLSYEWSLQGKVLRGDSDQITFPQSKKKDWIEVSVTPNDGKIEGHPKSAETRVANRAPSAVSLRMEPSNAIQAGTPIVARPHARDFDEDPVFYQYTWTVNGVTQSVDGDTLATDALRRGDVVQVSVVAGDGDDFSPPALSSEMKIDNAPPQIVSKPTSPDDQGSFQYLLQVEDADDRRFGYRLERAPEGMKIDLVTGRVDWEPREDQIGTFPVEIVVDDRSGGRARQSFELSIGSPEAGSQEFPAAPR